VNALEAFAACRSRAMVRRTMILAENRLMPEEVVALHARRDELPPDAQGWIRNLYGELPRDAPLPRFTRRTVAENVTLLAAEAPARTLLVMFCGQVPRPMLPLSLFLQRIPPGCDVAMLWDPERLMYLRGLQGFAEGPAALAARLRAGLDAGRYATLRCLGASSGGVAALAVGTLMGAEQAVALGGFHPAREAFWAPPGSELDLFAFDALLRDAPPAPTRLVCAYGVDHGLDPDRTAGLLKSFPQAVELPIAGVNDHNILLQLMRRGDLARFLDQVVFGRVAPEDWG
jgi:hypothetical protein